MRFQVPQNLDVSDTIILGLNFKQMLYLGGGGGFFIFPLFFGGGLLSAILIGGPVIILALLFSFFTFNSRPFVAVLQSMLQFVLNKKMYIWKQERGEEYTERKIKREDVGAAESTPHSESKRVKELGANLIFDDTPVEDGIRVDI